jgi:hypothetical protein
MPPAMPCGFLANPVAGWTTFSTWWRADNTGPDLPSEASLVMCHSRVGRAPQASGQRSGLANTPLGDTTGGSHRRSTLFSLFSRSARRRDRWARLGRDFGKSWVQDFESRLGVIVEPGLGRVRGVLRRTSRMGLGGSSSARGIVAPSSSSGMTGTLRSGAEIVPSDSAITARLSSQLMPCPSEAQSKPRKRGAGDSKNRHDA